MSGDDSSHRVRLGSVRSLAIKKGVLTHEVDEGSKCLVCGDGCPGFSLHFWRKVCKNCLCPREEHDVRPPEERQTNVGKILFSPDADTYHDNLSKGRVPMMKRESVTSGSDSDSPAILRKKENYTWTPKGVTLNAARAYFSDLPVDKRPIRDTPGDRFWQKQKIRQLPAHDIDILYCNDLTEEECKQMELFIKIRREKFLGRGDIVLRNPTDTSKSWKCEVCKKSIQLSSPAIIAEKLGADKCWHPHCFMCSECEELLVEMIYFNHKGQILCGRHHSEKLKPRCAACDEIIFCREYTRAEDQNWHITHFCCLRCDTQLAGQNYMAKEGNPYCLKCFGQVYPISCETCKGSISVDEARLSHEGKFWHSLDTCFKCETCEKPLVDQPFLPKLGKVFCCKECMKSFKKQLK